MPERQYICPVIETDTGFRASIGPVLVSVDRSYACIDLRGIVEHTDRTGVMLVRVPDVGGLLHEELQMMDGVSVFTNDDSKVSIDAAIGPEATDEVFDVGMGHDYVTRVAARRRARYVDER